MRLRASGAHPPKCRSAPRMGYLLFLICTVHPAPANRAILVARYTHPRARTAAHTCQTQSCTHSHAHDHTPRHAAPIDHNQRQTGNLDPQRDQSHDILLTTRARAYRYPCACACGVWRHVATVWPGQVHSHAYPRASSRYHTVWKLLTTTPQSCRATAHRNMMTKSMVTVTPLNWAPLRRRERCSASTDSRTAGT